MSDEITAEQQVEALLTILDELDEWTAVFVTSINGWIQHGRRLSFRQLAVLADKFDEYDPLWLKPRNRRAFRHPVSGKSVPIPVALQFLSEHLHALDSVDARFVQRTMAMCADGGGVTDRAAKRIKSVFMSAMLLPEWTIPVLPAAANQSPTPPLPPQPFPPQPFPPQPRPPQPGQPRMVVDPTRGAPGGLSVSVLGPTLSAEVSQVIAQAVAERATLKGPLH